MHTFTLVFFSNWMAGGKFGMSYIFSNRQKHKPKQNNGNKEKFK